MVERSSDGLSGNWARHRNLRSWVLKFLPSGVYLKACIARVGGFGIFFLINSGDAIMLFVILQL